jgi:hypothetical protein
MLMLDCLFANVGLDLRASLGPNCCVLMEDASPCMSSSGGRGASIYVLAKYCKLVLRRRMCHVGARSALDVTVNP